MLTGLKRKLTEAAPSLLEAPRGNLLSVAQLPLSPRTNAVIEPEMLAQLVIAEPPRTVSVKVWIGERQEDQKQPGRSSHHFTLTSRENQLAP